MSKKAQSQTSHQFERTVILVKPDGVQRGLIGQIVSRFEQKGLKLIAIKMIALNDPLLDQWYAHHKDKPFFADIKNYMKSSPIIAMIWEGLEAIIAVRKLTGTTHGRGAEAGSIRGDFSMSDCNNLIHSSDSPETAQKELYLLFTDKEIFNYDKSEYLHIYAPDEHP